MKQILLLVLVHLLVCTIGNGQDVLIEKSCYLPEGETIFCSPTNKESRETIQYILHELGYLGTFQVFQTDLPGIQAAIINGQSCLLHGKETLTPIKDQYFDDWSLSAELIQAIYFAILYQEAGDDQVCAGLYADSERFVGHALSVLGLEANQLTNTLTSALPLKAPGNRFTRIREAYQVTNDLAEAESIAASNFISPDLKYDAKVYGNYDQRVVQAASFPIIGDFWDEGYHITEVQYAEGSWFLVFQRKPKDFSTQAMRLRDRFPEDEIDDFWKDDYDISRIDYLKGQWYLCVTKFISDQRQLWRTRKAFPEKEIAEQWDKGYYVVDLSHGNGLYSLVMNKKPAHYRSQTWFLRNGFPEAEIKEHWATGHEITELEFINGQWALVMTKFNTRTTQKYLLRSSFPFEELETLTEQDYLIEHLTYANGQWLLVLNQQTSN